ncbi:MAG: RidA family protein [Acidobacteria bacterium]|nr:RidA family protein [Acidobacteriota bacterium]MBI3473606.1 RidA family protein [Candidatus Solibacter usitatus]
MRTTILLLTSALLAAPLFADRKAIQPKEFPGGRPFSPAILSGGTLYVAGQIGRDLKSNQVPSEFEAEVKVCLDNIGIILKEAGMGFDDVVTVNVYLTDMDLFERMNKVYVTYFKDPRPARTTVGVTRLAGPAKIEITVTARK